MYIDITTKITPDILKDAQENEKKTLTGHMGTHFEVMDKEFPLEYRSREAVMFVLFYSGFKINTYLVKYAGMTGLPCRGVAEC